MNETEMLLCHFGEMTRMELYTGEKQLSHSQWSRLKTAMVRRAKGEPLAYLLKEVEFYGHRFFVNEAVLVPRPETEILVEETLKQLPTNADVLDIGTGSGCIAVSLTLARPDIRMTALDVSEEALQIARKNRDFHGLQKRIRLLRSDLFGALGAESFDIIISNPPYIPEEDFENLPREVKHEPRLALDGGPGGLRDIRKILEEAPRFLKPGGTLFMEIGDGQSGILAEILAGMTEYDNFKFMKDYNGIDRVVIARSAATKQS